MIGRMSPDVLDAIVCEHNATVAAVQRAQARALHLGDMLRAVRVVIGKRGWEIWLQHHCPIPAGEARRYADEAKRLE